MLRWVYIYGCLRPHLQLEDIHCSSIPPEDQALTYQSTPTLSTTHYLISTYQTPETQRQNAVLRRRNRPLPRRRRRLSHREPPDLRSLQRTVKPSPSRLLHPEQLSYLHSSCLLLTCGLSPSIVTATRSAVPPTSSAWQTSTAPTRPPSPATRPTSSRGVPPSA